MKIFLSLLLMPALAYGAGGGLSKADALFSKSLYQEALVLYSAAAGAPGEEGLKASYRSVECEGLLSRYGEAAQRLSDMKLPSNPLWQGRFLLLRAETGRLFLQQYGYSLPSDTEKGTKDVTKLTSAQWRRMIEADYDSLWDLRHELVKHSLENQDYFLDLKGANLDYTPTLWDFAVLRWTQYLLAESEAGGKLPDAEEIAVADYRGDYSSSSPAASKAASIYKDAAGLGSGLMNFSREYWKIRRLLIPFEHGSRTVIRSQDKLRAAAIEVLKNWARTFNTPLARAWAGYQAGVLLGQNQDFAGVVEACKKAELELLSSRPASLCSKMRAEIEMPRLELYASFAPPPGGKTVRVSARNLPVVYFRAYRTSPAEISSLGADTGQGLARVRYLQEDVLRRFLARRADLEWESAISYPAPYAYKEQETPSPGFKKGVYVLVASGDSGFEDGSSLIKAVTINITDIFLLGTPGITGDPENILYDPANPSREIKADLFRLYAVNALTGKPLAGAGIDAYYQGTYSRNWQRVPLKTGPDGSAALNLPLKVKYPANQYYSLDPLLAQGGAYAYWNSYASTGLEVPEPVKIYVETDRPVYRPGQEVKFKVTALLREPRGYRTYDGKAKLTVTARDANWQEVYKKTLPFTGLGSAAGTFKIPEGRLLGRYSLSAEITEYSRNFSGAVNFGVEEYKRPEFEVSLEEAAKPYRYGQKAEITGAVKYYFGSPVPGAAVKYRVTRSRYVPWYCWYWSWFYGAGGSSEIASGETKTGDDGKFTVSFTPEPESAAYGDYPSSYQVQAEARDAGGRTIEDSRTYRAGARAYMFDITPEAGFFTPEQPASLRARLLDLNDVQQAGSASYSLYRIDQAPEGDAGQWQWGSFGRNPSLEQAFSKAPDGPRQDKGTVKFTKDAPGRIKLKALAPGVYRLKLEAKDPWGGKSESQVILVSASSQPVRNAALKLPPVALFERSSYQQGERARVLIGAAALKGVKYFEFVAGNYVLSSGMLREGGLSLLSFKVGRAHRGGFGLRWFGAGDFKVYSAMDEADVPLKDKALSLSMKYEKELAPGQKAYWRLKAKDHAGRPASGEAMIKIFDRSLEYYGKDSGFWGDSLYPKRPAAREGHGSLFTPYAIGLPVRTGVIQRMLEAFRGRTAEEKMASLRIGSSRLYGGYPGAGGYAAKSLMFEGESMARELAESDSSNMAMAVPQSVPRSNDKEDVSEKKIRNSIALSEAAPAEVKVRKDFSETAYYNPQLKVVKGSGRFSFTVPERLTSWKISSYLLTRSARRGSFSAGTVTKKDLMVRLDIPRFFREGDRSRLTAVLTNDTKGVLSGEVALLITLDGNPAQEGFGVKEPSRAFSIKPNGTVPVYWDIEAPRGTAAYKIRAVARAGQLSDAQENDLPVLPSRERLIASGVAALDGNSSKTFRLEELEEKDSTRRVESLHVEIQPQLILTVINSLPYLVHYPHECTEQLLNRYVPLAIANSFYRKYPELSASVAKIPKRSTITPEWERDNPARMMTLMESPWEQQSKGRKTSQPIVDMLDPEVVDREKEEALSKLKAYQNPDGSFPWFPGGHPNLYMTLYVLEGLAEASRYGVEIPEGMAKKALSYALAEIPSHLKPEEDQASLVLYAGYVATSFPSSWRESKTALTYAKAWVDYADKHSNAMTAFGKAYAAYVYLRLGEKAKAESYLDRAMDGARTDDIAGVYWSPEKISWLWYNDTVEKHAFILRTLLAVRPGDARIAGMVRWLLFNRKANEWKSTKASAAAIYSLLDVMKAKGALDKPESFSLKWGEISEKAELKPFDWVAKPLRWSKYGAGIGKDDLAPVIEKKGPGLAFASFTGIYTTDKTVKESPAGMMNVSRKYFLREKDGADYSLKPLSDGATVAVGDQIEVHLTVKTRSRFEYVYLKDPKPAGFEAETLNSGWKWDQLGRYEEPKDSLTNFFMERLPHGEYVLKYRLRPTTPGTFKAGGAVIQSMYAPEFAAHSSGMTLRVK